MIKDLISLIFPEICAFCKAPTIKGENLLCTKCLLDLPKTNDHRTAPGDLVQKFVTIRELQFLISSIWYIINQTNYSKNNKASRKISIQGHYQK